MSLRVTIQRLFGSAKALDADQNPIVKKLREELPPTVALLECQVVLKSGDRIAGVLTVTPDATLRMSSVAATHDKKVMFADLYFCYEDVESVQLASPMPDRLVAPVRSNGPIIIGH